MSEYYALIGQRLRQCRVDARLTRREVVEEMKRRGYRLSISSLQDFEAGRRLNLQALMQLAQVLHCHPALLLGLSLSEELDLDQLEHLVRRSRALSDYEKEFFYAAFAHVHKLRQRGPVADTRTVPVEAFAPAVRRAVLELLRRGGAFTVKEMLALPQFAAVPETLVQREVLALKASGLVEPVCARPVRYALRTLAEDEGAELEL